MMMAPDPGHAAANDCTPAPRPAQRIVGIADIATSTAPNECLITYSLGSCIALALHDPTVGAAGLIHAMLPNSALDPARAAAEPGRFTDTAVTALLAEMFALGARRASLVAKVAGAATQVDQHGLFRIGERNLAVLRRVLWKNDILIAAQDTGGAVSRTMVVETATGRTLVKSNGSTREL
jgi:chemotaxis protein CheD